MLYARSAFRATYRSPRRIAADSLGITWEPILGHDRVLRWEDARLLEVDTVEIAERWDRKKIERRRYTLYGRDTVIWWTEPQKVYARPSGQYAQLLDLIAARTGLIPRTFKQELSAAHGSLLTRRETADAGEMDPPAVADDKIYARAHWGTSTRGRTLPRAIGCCLIAGGLAAMLRAIAGAGVVALPGILAALTGWINLAAGCVLVPAGLIGVVMVVGSFARTPGAVVLADATGIRIQNVGNPTALTWSSITDVRLHPGAAGFYIVQGESKHEYVVWPASLSTREGGTPPPDTIPLAPDEMAALVARRIGHPLLADPP